MDPLSTLHEHLEALPPEKRREMAEAHKGLKGIKSLTAGVHPLTPEVREFFGVAPGDILRATNAQLRAAGFPVQEGGLVTVDTERAGIIFCASLGERVDALVGGRLQPCCPVFFETDVVRRVWCPTGTGLAGNWLIAPVWRFTEQAIVTKEEAPERMFAVFRACCDLAVFIHDLVNNQQRQP